MDKKNWFGKQFPLGLLVLLAMIAVGLAGCEKKKATLETLTVIAPNTAVATPVVSIAKEKGYFEEEGLAPEFVTFSGSAGIEALSIGKADVLLQGIIPGLSYGAQGAPLKVFAGTASGGNYFIVKPENVAKYQNIANWAGIKFGTIRLSTSELVTRHALTEANVPGVVVVEIDAFPNIIEAVRKGAVDVASVPAEYRQPALDLGLEMLFPMTTFAPDYVCCREVGNAKTLASKRSAYVKFLKAQIRAYRDLQVNQQEVVSLLAKASSQTEEYVTDVLFNLNTNGNRIFNPDPNFKGVKAVYDTLLSGDYVEDQGISADDLVDTSVYKEALDDIVKRYPDEVVYQQLLVNYKEKNL
jgi:NitT/TauT family transport system substrate-binding protein